MNLGDFNKKLLEKIVSSDESGVAEYVRSQIDWLIVTGENISDYELVRETKVEYLSVKVVYSIKKQT